MPEQHDEGLEEPEPVRTQPGPEGERTMAQRIRGNRRSLELTGLILVLFAINLFWSAHTKDVAVQTANRTAAVAEAKLQKAISASCNLWLPLTALPVTIPAGMKRPTPLSVHLIAGARESYAGQCQNDGHPPLPPPDPSLVKWAGIYHIPVAR
jgi:hypothetical protein